MNTLLLVACSVLFMGTVIQPAHAQKINLGEVLVVNMPVLKSGADTGTFESHVIDEILPYWDALGDQVETHFFRADRGKDIGRYWIVWNVKTREHRKMLLPENQESGFSPDVLEKVGQASTLSTRYVSQEGGYTDYELIGAERITALPEVELLGIHYIQVRKDRRAAFDEFVRETLHPALVGQIPGMDLLYYKGVRGEHAGQYLTIFAIESVEARERYWPTNAPETKALKDAFEPLVSIARQLSTYLVEDSYLKADTGAAAAIFESLEWTDFAFLK